jgi:hypothetical protein
MTIEELREEVTELTDLMRDDGDFAGIRKVLAAQGLSPDDTVLAGLISGGDDSQYGVLLTGAGECVVFETDPRGSLVRWETVEDITTLAEDFGAVAVGAEMKRNGEIT